MADDELDFWDLGDCGGDGEEGDFLFNFAFGGIIIVCSQQVWSLTVSVLLCEDMNNTLVLNVVII